MSQDTLAQSRRGTDWPIRFRASDELWERLNIVKVKRRTSVQEILTKALTEHLDKIESEMAAAASKSAA